MTKLISCQYYNNVKSCVYYSKPEMTWTKRILISLIRARKYNINLNREEEYFVKQENMIM